MFIAFNINYSSILPLMALNGLYCADVPLSNYSLTHSSLQEIDGFNIDNDLVQKFIKEHSVQTKQGKTIA